MNLFGSGGIPEPKLFQNIQDDVCLAVLIEALFIDFVNHI